MKGATYSAGGDAKAISRIAQIHFSGSYKEMFEAHGWKLEQGQQYMHQASARIKQQYGSIAKFEAYFDSKDVL